MPLIYNEKRDYSLPGEEKITPPVKKDDIPAEIKLKVKSEQPYPMQLLSKAWTWLTDNILTPNAPMIVYKKISDLVSPYFGTKATKTPSSPTFSQTEINTSDAAASLEDLGKQIKLTEIKNKKIVFINGAFVISREEGKRHRTLEEYDATQRRDDYTLNKVIDQLQVVVEERNRSGDPTEHQIAIDSILHFCENNIWAKTIINSKPELREKLSNILSLVELIPKETLVLISTLNDSLENNIPLRVDNGVIVQDPNRTILPGEKTYEATVKQVIVSLNNLLLTQKMNPVALKIFDFLQNSGWVKEMKNEYPAINDLVEFSKGPMNEAAANEKSITGQNKSQKKH